MDRRSLGLTAVILIALMGIVATAGLDDLPRALRESVDAAGTQLKSDRGAFDGTRQFVEQALRDEPVLFQDRAAGWRERISRDGTRLTEAAASLAALQQLAKANRRTDTENVQRALADFDAKRQEPVRDISQIRTEAERWIGYKRDLPRRMETMRVTYDSLKAFDVNAATPAVQKALVDWPAKKDDLQSRLDAVKALLAQGEQVWDSTAPARAAFEAKNEAGLDYAALFTAADQLDSTARQVKDSAASLNALAGQLYVSRDKLLLDVDGDREKVRVVTTRFSDATLSNGQTSSEERWENIDSGRVREAENSAGMMVERKPAGKYDSEAERAVQPPAYAYIAPPGQANAYGSWQNGVWQWLPQYLLLSHLLNASRGPVTTGDFDAFERARRRGEVFYGRNNEYRWYGHRDGGSWSSGGLRRTFDRMRDRAESHERSGGWYTERAKPSWGDRGFGGSKYESHGSYSGSRYQAHGGFGSRPSSRSFGRSFGRAFGRGGRR